MHGLTNFSFLISRATKIIFVGSLCVSVCACIVCMCVCVLVVFQRMEVYVNLNLYNYRFPCEFSLERTTENGVYEEEMRSEMKRKSC